ncbi:MAG: metallophosphoesterase [Tatlockia sp.]|jgi:Icc protein
MVEKFYSQDRLKIIQLTDTHLVSNNSELFGFNTNDNFNRVMDSVFKKEINDTDFILLTGDLSQDETAGSYQYLLDAFQPCSIPVFWIPGNHDDFELMNTVFNQSSLFNFPKFIDLKHWIFLFINTQLEGSINGYINSNDLLMIKNQLSEAAEKNKNIVLVMHHHPTEVDTPLIDEYILNNREELWSIISDSRVKMIISGHVHGDYSFNHRGVKIECAPATCFQFQKGSTSLQIENSIGYKIHNFELGSVDNKLH